MSEKELGHTYTEGLKRHIEQIPQELLELSEKDLRKKINPSLKLYEVKRAFWEELYLAQEQNREMRMWRVYDGKFSKQYFYDKVIKNFYKLAWIIQPLNSYEDKTKAALDKITERYEELIGMDINVRKKVKTEDGTYDWVTEVDPKKAALLLAVIKNLEDRVKGTAIQRNVTATIDGPSKKTRHVDMDKVDDRLKELEEKLGMKRIEHTTNADAIDITTEI